MPVRQRVVEEDIEQLSRGDRLPRYRLMPPPFEHLRDVVDIACSFQVTCFRILERLESSRLFEHGELKGTFAVDFPVSLNGIVDVESPVQCVAMRKPPAGDVPAFADVDAPSGQVTYLKDAAQPANAFVEGE